MTAPPRVVREAAGTRGRMTFVDLRIAYLAPARAARPDVLRAYLAGRGACSIDYDVLAHAINERFLDRGENYPVPYRDELL